MKKFVLIDGNALIHRGFHAIPPLYTKSGEMTNAVYGFTTVFLGVLRDEAPDYIAVTFDKKGPTVRHEQFEDYKATRVKATDELYAQIPRIKEVVEAFRIPIFEKSGYEADDVIATLTKILSEEDLQIVIVTGDKDALQLVSKNVVMAAPRKGYNEVLYYTPEVVEEKLGIKPEQVVDYKGLCGDSSDNIPGVAGIGPKTAATLLQKYGTLEGIYEHVDEVAGKAGEKLVADRDNAFMSRDLAQLIYDVPVEFELEDCHTHDVGHDEIKALFEELEFSSLLRKFNLLNGQWEHEKREKEFTDSQMSMF